MKLNSSKLELMLAENGITKGELANRCGISRQNVSIIVRRGTCEPRTMGRLASGLGVSVTELVKEE